jgi:adenosine deaminase
VRWDIPQNYSKTSMRLLQTEASAELLTQARRATYISKAVDLCNVERIDHGIRLADDKALMMRVAEQKILVTMCPISNVKLRCVKELKELPIRTFLDNGVHFSINSDDPAYFGGYILDNYCAVQEAFELTLEDWMHIAKSAVNGSWCDNQRKQALIEQLGACLHQFTTQA